LKTSSRIPSRILLTTNIILTAPDILDRYFSVEVADVYTNNLFYIGTRATGGKGGNHAFVEPNWKGELPKDVIEHRVPSNSYSLQQRRDSSDDEERFLVVQHVWLRFSIGENPINRFSIGDRTKGLTYNPDGSLDIYIQNQAPGEHGYRLFVRES
jgi:hypothetical protein